MRRRELPEPQTYEEWWLLVEQHRHSAKLLVSDKNAANQGYFHVGLAVEAALKAYIFKNERFTQWPNRRDDPNLYTHNLWKLFERSGIIVDKQSNFAPSWNVVLQWNRLQGYDCGKMPCNVAQSFYDAAFGECGVVIWLQSN